MCASRRRNLVKWILSCMLLTMGAMANMAWGTDGTRGLVFVMWFTFYHLVIFYDCESGVLLPGLECGLLGIGLVCTITSAFASRLWAYWYRCDVKSLLEWIMSRVIVAQGVDHRCGVNLSCWVHCVVCPWRGWNLHVNVAHLVHVDIACCFLFIQISISKGCEMLNPWHFGTEIFWSFLWKKPYNNDIGCLIHDIWVSSFFWQFHGKNHYKNDIGCPIPDIWVSSFFWYFQWKNPYENDIGGFIRDIWVSSSFF